jgi:hypothetical protein
VFTPLAVVIDNGPGAVLQLGLEKSDFIIELPAEGEITRLLAFFDPHNLVDKIGPVRSARPYFLDFVEEWQGVFAHAGGSPQVLSDLKSGRYNLIDVDEIGPGGRYFWRTQDRPAPHNLFTSSVLLKSAYDVLVSARAKKIKYDEVAWKWTDEHLPNSLLRGGTEGGVKITIDYSTYNYQVEYQYDVDSQKYKRYQGGRPLQTEQGEEILIDNILIAKMGVRVIDKEARLKIQTTGEGEAVICRDGECQNGIWKKPSAGQRIRFYITDEAGESEEVELKPGRTWLNVVPVGRRVEIGN